MRRFLECFFGITVNAVNIDAHSFQPEEAQQERLAERKVIMQLVLLNGTPDRAGRRLPLFLDSLVELLEKSDHKVTRLDLDDMKLNRCKGCFNCWWKTPGRCIQRDDGDALCREVIRADSLLMAAPLEVGFVHPLLKGAVERLIPLLLPYIELVEDECHHKKRYESYPSFSLILEEEDDTTEEDLAIVETIFKRLSLNFRSRLRGVYTTTQSIEEVAHALGSH